LDVGDLTSTLAAAPGCYDLLIAADVLVYLGDLSGVFDAAARAMRPGGLFAFTVEAHDGQQGYLLRASRRYAHSAGYVRETAARSGWKEVSFQGAVLRKEHGQDMPGLVVVLRRPAKDD